MECVPISCLPPASPGAVGANIRAERHADRPRAPFGPRCRRGDRRGRVRGDPGGSGRAEAPRARRRHAVHLPQPGPVDRPGADTGRGPVPGGRGLELSAPGAIPGCGPTPLPGRSPATRRTRGPLRPPDHYGALRSRPGPDRRPPWRGSDGGRPSSVTTTPWSTGPPPTGPGSAGSGRTHSCSLPGLGSWFVLGSVVTDAPLRPDRARRAPGPTPPAAGSCTRCMTACPTGALVAPGVARRPSLPGLVGPGPGVLPRGAPAGAGGPHLRVRRVPAGLPDQPAGRPAGSAAAAPEPTTSRGWTCSTCSRPPTRSCWPPTAAGTSRPGIPDTCGATPWWPWATSATGADPATERALRHWLAVDDALLAEHAQWAARRLGPADDLVGPSGR